MEKLSDEYLKSVSEKVTNVLGHYDFKVPTEDALIATELLSTRAELAALQDKVRWVPVGERLPETQKPVWISCVKDGKRFQQRAVYIASHSVLSEDFLSDECDCSDVEEYDETDDCYWVKEGWWESHLESDSEWCISGEVTHWMPLPSSPIPAEGE